MLNKKVYTAIGLMSGTSLDAVDAALIETDGLEYIKPLDFISVPYKKEERAAIREAFGKSKYDENVARAQDIVTQAHLKVLRQANWQADIIGFHGQTTYHNPEQGISVQIGDSKVLAKELGIPVVYNFRTQDVKSGGQGAPLLPLYHFMRLSSHDLSMPVAVLNIGGVANITFIDGNLNSLIAFDTGPGNALMDDFMFRRFGLPCDRDGKIAAQGQVQAQVLEQWMAHPYFSMAVPKSLDRDIWDVSSIETLSDADAMATLLAFTVSCIYNAHISLPEKPQQYFVCGGGRHNAALMKKLEHILNTPIHSVESLGWNGDATEAEGFGYFAVRHVLGLPITFPGTTGVKMPLTAGELCRP